MVGSKTRRHKLLNMLVQLTIARLNACGKTTRRQGCMFLPSPLFEQLCGRLLNRRFTVAETVNWLRAKFHDAPTKSSIYRFAGFLFKEFDKTVRDFARRRR